MGDTPALARRATSSSQPIASLSSPTPSTSSTASSSFPSLKPSSVSRKKPAGLSISKSARGPPSLADFGSGDLTPGGSGARTKDGGLAFTGWQSEADRLRQDIERLQLNSDRDAEEAMGPGARAGQKAGGPRRDQPMTPGPGASDSSIGSASAKKRSGKKKHRDKEDTVKDEDLDIISDLGAGNGGTVTKVWNKKRGCVMARKLILVDAKPSVRKQILRELQIMSDCNSEYIVGYFGCFPVDVHVAIVIEYMDAGSLDQIYRNHGPVSIEIVGKVAEAVLGGLMYLYDVHRIIHRDIKPSNILANTAGQIKICDFGVSGELINSIANTFVGTSTYMSPERIQGAPYTIKSDVWSLGISLIELALGRFPFSDSVEHDPDPTLPISTQRPVSNGTPQPGHAMSILDLLQHIVNEPAPQLVSPRREFPPEAVAFVEGCLDKDPDRRKSPQELFTSPWITQSRVTGEDLVQWALAVVGKKT